MYIDKLDDIINKFNNTYHRTIKVKPVDVRPCTYIDSSKQINNQDPEFKIGDIVRISKCKKNFAKCYVPNWSEEICQIKNVKSTVPWTYIISYLKREEIIGTFHKKNAKNKIKKSLELKSNKGKKR